MLYRGAAEDFDLLIYCVACQLAAIGITFLRRDQSVCWCWLSTALAIYVCYLVVATSWSSLPENSLIESWLLVSLVLVFFCVSQMRETAWKLLFVLVVAIGLISAIWGLSEFTSTGQRANGPVIDPSAWGISMNLLFFFVLSSYLRSDHPKAHRFAHEAALAAYAAASFAAYSRVGTVVWFVAVFLLTALSLFRHSSLRQVRMKILKVALIGLVCFSLVHSYAGQTEASHSEGYTVNFDEKGWQQRFAIWRSAWKLYTDNPWYGIGVGTFKVNYPQYRTTGDLHTIGNYVHNDYLQLLVEGGPVLLFYALLVAAAVAWICIANLNEESDKRREVAIESLVLGVAIATVFAHALMSFALLQLAIQIVIGLMLARLVTINLWGRSYDVVLTRSTQVLFILVLTLPFCLLYLDGMSYNIVYKKSGLPFSRFIRQDQRLYFEVISSLAKIRPGNSVNRVALATLYRMNMDRENRELARRSLGVTAALEYEAALAHNPWRYMTHIYLAELLRENQQLYEELPHLPEPARLLSEAIQRAPVYLEPYLAMAEHLRRIGLHRDAYMLLKEQAFVWINLPVGNRSNSRMRVLVQLKELAAKFGDTEMLERIRLEEPSDNRPA